MSDVQRVVSVLAALGASNVKDRGDRVTCSCLLAPWEHAGGSDSRPSMVVFPSGRHGDPIYKCQGCGATGSLEHLVLLLSMRRGRMEWPALDILWGNRVFAKPLESPKREGALLRRIRRIGARGVDGRPVTLGDGKRAVGGRELDLSVQGDMRDLGWEKYEKSRIKTKDDMPGYLVNRGVSFDTALAWKLGVAWYSKSVLLPVQDDRGRLVSITKRKWVSGCANCGSKNQKDGKDCSVCGKWVAPKYIHSSGFKSAYVLYGEHLVKGGGRVFVVEGQFDAIMMWQAGYPAVCIFGAHPSMWQVSRLVKRWDWITCVCDGDKAGRTMYKVMDAMVGGDVPVTKCEMPDGEDAASMLRSSPDEFRRIVGDPAFESVLRAGPSSRA